MPEKTKKTRTPGTKPEKVRGKGTRAVQKIHQFKWGDGLSEAEQDEPGWQRFVLKPLETDTRIKTTREMLAGGVESGLPCRCNHMTMWVQTVSALRMMEEAGVTVEKEEHRRTLAASEVAILICPHCETITQAPVELARKMRAQFLARRDQ